MLSGEEAGPESGPKKADESGTRASNAADTAGPTPLGADQVFALWVLELLSLFHGRNWQ